jgi:hypothetical protein
MRAVYHHTPSHFSDNSVYWRETLYLPIRLGRRAVNPFACSTQSLLRPTLLSCHLSLGMHEYGDNDQDHINYDNGTLF